jgi:hypothetical protein
LPAIGCECSTLFFNLYIAEITESKELQTSFQCLSNFGIFGNHGNFGNSIQPRPVFARLTLVAMAKENDWAMTTYSSRLAPIVLPDPDGRETRLGSLWSDSAAVLVFLRHYG